MKNIISRKWIAMILMSTLVGTSFPVMANENVSIDMAEEVIFEGEVDTKQKLSDRLLK